MCTFPQQLPDEETEALVVEAARFSYSWEVAELGFEPGSSVIHGVGSTLSRWWWYYPEPATLKERCEERVEEGWELRRRGRGAHT